MAKSKAVPPATNAFTGSARPPTDQELRAALGSSHELWRRLLVELAGELGLTRSEWSSYSPKAGWSLRVKRGDRIILYLAPMAGSFRASFALGDKAVKAALSSGLPEAAMQLIRSARKYAEGTAVRIEVQTVADIAVVKKLAQAKQEN